MGFLVVFKFPRLQKTGMESKIFGPAALNSLMCFGWWSHEGVCRAVKEEIMRPLYSSSHDPVSCAQESFAPLMALFFSTPVYYSLSGKQNLSTFPVYYVIL